MAELETILSSIKRPGDFYIRSAMEIPMPKIEVDGFGVLSFPVTSFQVKQLIDQVIRAPFGQGEETVYDLSVQNVWQLPSEKLRISGSSWLTHFEEILSQVRDGLGCLDVPFSAELYKMLIYDEGSIFKAHRDTEKTENMFGTLVVVLPSMHKGGELFICHAGKKVTVDLSNSSVSELTFAAFYADCEHKMLPISEGNRLCLVYNLIQKFDAKRSGKFRQKKLVAPMYDGEIEKATKVLESSLNRENSPTKIAYLLEHQYNQAALSFAMLKYADETLAKFLCQVAHNAKCAIHLAFIHFKEFGDLSEGGNFNIAERYANGWVNVDNKVVDFGKIPIKEGEILPNGALYGQLPDKQGCTDAARNEGVTFERSYCRAALVIWRLDSYPKVLLQTGVCRVLPYLKDFIEKRNPNDLDDFQEINDLLNIIFDNWVKLESEATYSEMMSTLIQLDAIFLIERFISKVVIPKYDGKMNALLVSVIKIMDPDLASTLLCSLVTVKMRKYPGCCMKLLSSLFNAVGAETLKWKDELESIATAVVIGMKYVGNNSSCMCWKSNLDSSSVVELWNTLLQLQQDNLQIDAAEEIISCPSKFDPKKLLIPVLCKLYKLHKEVMHSNASFIQLWNHTSQFLLSRSQHPPKMPIQLRQQVTLSCKCLDCTKLQKFVCNPQLQKVCFPLANARRKHLENMIVFHKLPLTTAARTRCIPYTLVCKKIFRPSLYADYKQKFKKYQDDVAAMKLLIPLVPEELRQTAELRGKLRLHL